MAELDGFTHVDLNDLTKIEVYAVKYGVLGADTLVATYVDSTSSWSNIAGITVDKVNNTIDLETELFDSFTEAVDKNVTYTVYIRGYFSDNALYVQSAPVYKVFGVTGSNITINDGSNISLNDSTSSATIEVKVATPITADHLEGFMNNITSITPIFIKKASGAQLGTAVSYSYFVREVVPAVGITYSVTIPVNVNEMFDLTVMLRDSMGISTTESAKISISRAPDGRFVINNPFSVHVGTRIKVSFAA